MTSKSNDAPKPSVAHRLHGKSRAMGRWSSDPTDPVVSRAPAAEGDSNIHNTLMWNHCVRMHRQIPKEVLIKWIHNMRSYVEALTTEGESHIVLGCSCSGTGIWSKVFDLLITFWGEEFGLDDPDVCTTHAWACGLDTNKQKHLTEHHQLGALFADVTTLCNNKVFDLLSQEEVYVDWLSKYTSGFSCKDFSKQNRNRAKGRT